eukprot:scaffold1426_cov83-Cylindrotheca_fusiformis.AAC.14
MTRFDHLLDLDRSWKSDMLRAVNEALAVDFSSRRREIDFDDLGSEGEEQIANRESCRINSGASIVIPHMLPFLDNLDVENYFAYSS